MSDWIKRVFLGIAVLGLLAAAPAQAQNGRGQGNGAGASANVVQLRPTGVVHGQYIVVLRDHVGDPRAVANALARAHGLGLGLVYSSALKGFSARIPERALAALARDPRVDYIEADQWVQAFAQTIPTGVERIFAYENLNITIDGSDDYRIDVDVAVIDTGIDLDHPDLNVVGSTNCAKGGPFGGDCKDGEGNDGNGHGTHVAGTIAAIDNGIGVVGVAPGARLWAVRVLDNNGSGWMSWIIGGIDWVTANADIIEVANMSLGCECSSSAMNTAIANSVAAGVVYAVAAGNSNKDAATFSPANHPDVITVSALADFDGLAGGLGSPTCRTDQDDTGADFSNWGSLIEVAAPGVCILSTWNDGGTNTISGTSMASPHAAGAAALLASGASDPTSKADVDAIIATIVAEGNFDWIDDSGDGIPEPFLDVGYSPVFNPATVAGEGGTTPASATPVASITSPADNSIIASGATILFEGTASDTEDGDLTASLVWTSDLDGQIGTGGSFSTTLSDGNHTITAEVTDSGSATGSSSIAVEVSNVPPAVAITNPVDGSTSDSGATILFEGTASDTEDGDVTASLVWTSDIDGQIGTGGSFSTTLSDGNHTITASAIDSGSKTGTDSVSITVGTPPAEATTVSVDSITYATEGGKNQDKHLLITVTLEDDLFNLVEGASVSIDLYRDNSKIASGTATTGTDGTVTFSLKNAKSGCYTTDVTDVIVGGLIWDGADPANGFCK